MLEFTPPRPSRSSPLALNLEKTTSRRRVSVHYLQLKEGDEVPARAACSRCRSARNARTACVDACVAIDGSATLHTTHTRSRITGARHHRAAAVKSRCRPHQVHRRDDPDRPRPAELTSVTPHGQDGVAVDTIINQKGTRRHLRVRRHRPEGVHHRLGRRALRQTARWNTRSSSPPRRPIRRRLLYIAPYSVARWRVLHVQRGKPTLCVYDDLSKQPRVSPAFARAWRRPPAASVSG